MRHIHEDPGLAGAVDRYVRPCGRYLNFLQLTGNERTAFVRSLTAAARHATTQELTLLLEGIAVLATALPPCDGYAGNNPCTAAAFDQQRLDVNAFLSKSPWA